MDPALGAGISPIIGDFELLLPSPHTVSTPLPPSYGEQHPAASPAQAVSAEAQTPAVVAHDMVSCRDYALGGQDGPAFQCLSFLAQQGNSAAQNDIAYAYENGVGTAKDLTKAMSWYRQAAEQDSSFGLWNVGRLYQNGIGVAQDPVEAQQWIAKATDLRSEHNRICKAQSVKQGIIDVEKQEVEGPDAQAMEGLVSLATGSVPHMGEFALLNAATADDRQDMGHFVFDLAGQTGGFVCEAVFLRTGAHIDALDDSDSASQISDSEMNSLLQEYPNYTDDFQVLPLAEGGERVTLIPTAIDLSTTYSEVVQ